MITLVLSRRRKLGSRQSKAKQKLTCKQFRQFRLKVQLSTKCIHKPRYSPVTLFSKRVKAMYHKKNIMLVTSSNLFILKTQS